MRATIAFLLALALATPSPARASAAPAAPAFLAPLATAISAATADVPKNDGWVTDLAHFLSGPEEQALESSMEAYKRASGHDIALLTVPNLGGQEIEEYALQVARSWKMGSPERHDAALLVVARAERKLRIEVGDGLEGTLTDARCAQIIRDTITPYFKSSRFGDGLRAGVAAMQATAGGAPPGSTSPAPASAPIQNSSPISDIGSAICPIAALVFLFMLIWILRRIGGPPIGGMRRRGWGLGMPMGGWSSGGGGFGGGSSGGGFSGFGGGGRFSGGGASGGW